MCAELFYRSVPNNYTYKHEQISNKMDDVEILVLGDSHTFYGINPEWLSLKTYNLSNVSQTIYFDSMLFYKHIDHLPSLKYLIISVEYTTLSQVDNTQEDIWRKYFYEAQMGLKVPLIDWYDPKKYSLALTRKFDKTFKTFFDYQEEGTLIGCDERGWGNTYQSTVDSLEMAYLSKVVARKHEDGSMDFNQNTERIQKMITFCEQRNIQVLLVNMPVYPDYLNHLNPEKLIKIDKTCDYLTKTNSNVTRVDLSSDFRFQLQDFHDADHLNAQGAKKCTLLINDYINLY